MKRAARVLALTVTVVLACASCTRIKLTKEGSTGSGSTGIATPAPQDSGGGGGFQLPSFSLPIPGFNNPPPLTGDWNITYVYKGDQQDSTVSFNQVGKTLTGGGEDGNHLKFIVVKGTVDGKKVHFTKKYAENDPSLPEVDYTGELSYQDDKDFKGWTIGGHYKATIKGEVIEDKWIAMTSAAAALSNPQPAQPQGDQQGQPQAGQQAQPSLEQPGGDQGQQPDTASGGEQSGEIPPDVSGMYSARYEYNFNPVESRLWLKQDGNKISGDGTDTNTGEYFVISKGFYGTPPDKAPRVMLVFKYQKGKHAKADRTLTIKATEGAGPSLHGETQFGSPWNATYVAH